MQEDRIPKTTNTHASRGTGDTRRQTKILNPRTGFDGIQAL